MRGSIRKNEPRAQKRRFMRLVGDEGLEPPTFSV